MATNLSRNFDAFLKVWNMPNYDRTEEEQEFCLAFRRQIIPTMISLLRTSDYITTLKLIEATPYRNQIKMAWESIYGPE